MIIYKTFIFSFFNTIQYIHWNKKNYNETICDMILILKRTIIFLFTSSLHLTHDIGRVHLICSIFTLLLIRLGFVVICFEKMEKISRRLGWFFFPCLYRIVLNTYDSIYSIGYIWGDFGGGGLGGGNVFVQNKNRHILNCFPNSVQILIFTLTPSPWGEILETSTQQLIIPS